MRNLRGNITNNTRDLCMQGGKNPQNFIEVNKTGLDYI